MDEWWTYRPSDFLLFSRETYYGLFEQYHASVWPAQLVMLGAWMALTWLLRRPPSWGARAIAGLLALPWLWVGWAFHEAHFSSINPVARHFAVAFHLQAALLLLLGSARGRLTFVVDRSVRTRAAVTLLLTALVIVPAAGMIAGRSWRQSEIIGATPDATAIGTLAVLLLARGRARPVLLAIPLLWCGLAAIMLWSLGSRPEAFVALLAILLSAVALAGGRKRPAEQVADRIAASSAGATTSRG